jgi:hypothetical protein
MITQRKKKKKNRGEIEDNAYISTSIANVPPCDFLKSQQIHQPTLIIQHMSCDCGKVIFKKINHNNILLLLLTLTNQNNQKHLKNNLNKKTTKL